jgi:CHAT domain-containing protein/Tfp pilus assembly protein PilF
MEFALFNTIYPRLINRVSKCLPIIFLIALLASSSAVGQSTDNLLTQFEEAKELYYFDQEERAGELFDHILPGLCSSADLMEQCAESYIYKSVLQRLNRDFEQAGDYLEDARIITEEYLDLPHPLMVEIYVQHSYLFDEMTQTGRAQQWSVRAYDYAIDHQLDAISLARAYINRGYLSDSQGNYEEAIEFYRSAIELLESESSQDLFEIKRMQSIVYNNIGVSHRRLGQYDQAMDYYQKAYDAAIETFGQYHTEIALLYNSMGTFYYSIGDIGTAADYFIQSGSIFEEVRGEYNNRVAQAYNNAGVSFLNIGDIENATYYLERAQRIKEEILGPDHPDTAVGYHNLASIYKNHEEYDKAEQNYRLSLQVRKAIHGNNHPSLIISHVNLGQLYTQTGELMKAREYYQAALDIGIERLGEAHPDVLGLYASLGETYRKEGRLNEANSYYRKSLSILIDETYQPLITVIDPSEVNYPSQLLEIIRDKAELNFDIYREQGNREMLYEVMRLYTSATETIEFLQFQYQSEASKLSLLENNYSIFTGATDAMYELYRETGEDIWVSDLIELSEKSRARIALELFQTVRARNFGNVPEPVLEQERKLNEQVTFFFQQLHLEQEKGLEADHESLRIYQDSLFHARRDLMEFTESLEDDYPLYYAVKYDQSIADTDQIQSLLEPDESILLFVYGSDQLYGLVIENDLIEIKKLGSHEEIDQLVDHLRHSILNHEDTHYKSTSHDLYLTLFEPLEEFLNGSSLIILPDQKLHYLPFELLLTSKADETDFHRLPYLIRDYQIQYAPSATVFNTMQQQRPPDPRNMMAFAPFNDSGHEAAPLSDDHTLQRYISGLSPLPLTDYETAEISRIFEERRGVRDFFFPNRATVYKGEEAHIGRLMTPAVQNYNYLHFATHAFVNESRPELSGIVFNSGNPDSDGILYVGDIYNLRLNADLVVLGACETGLGTIRKGEGLIGFTRAFIYSGTSNLLVSMWRVNDQPTSRLMINFYHHVRNGDSYGSALQSAKLDLINNPETSHPINWAAFILNGR